MSDDLDIDPYHGLAQLEPTEWHNIPRPITESLRVFKELAIEHTNKIQDIADTILGNERNNNEEFKKIGKEIQTIKAVTAKTQTETLNKIEDVNNGFFSEMSKFKSALLVDLDYKQKNNDSKISYLEEQIFHIRKFINSAPTTADIDNKIADACGDLKVKLKSEIKETMIAPEIRGLNYDIRELSMSMKNLICETEDRIAGKQKKILDSIDHMMAESERLQRKISAVGTKQNEAQENLVAGLKKIEDIKSYIESVEKRQGQGLERLDLKISPILKSISTVDVRSQETKEKAQDMEKRLQSAKDIIIQMESAIVTIAKGQEEYSKQLNEYINKAKKSKAKAKNVTKGKKSIDEEFNYQIKDDENDADEQLVNKKPEIRLPLFDHSGGSETAIKDFKTELAELKESLLKTAKDTEEKLINQVEKTINELNDNVRKIKKENDESFTEINDKLKWFPVNVKKMSDMTPSEARLFTLEARLRSEENSRIRAFNFLGKLIEGVRYSKNNYPFPDIQGKDRFTPEGINNIDILKKLGDIDKKTTEARENYSGYVENSINEDSVMSTRRNHKTPRSRDITQEIAMREARTNSVLGKRTLRKSLY